MLWLQLSSDQCQNIIKGMMKRSGRRQLILLQLRQIAKLRAVLRNHLTKLRYIRLRHDLIQFDHGNVILLHRKNSGGYDLLHSDRTLNFLYALRLYGNCVCFFHSLSRSHLRICCLLCRFRYIHWNICLSNLALNRLCHTAKYVRSKIWYIADPSGGIIHNRYCLLLQLFSLFCLKDRCDLFCQILGNTKT